MVNERIDTIRHYGTDFVLVRFDLSDPELLALARCLDGVVDTRYRTAALSSEEILELRELTELRDAAFARAEDGYDGGTLLVGRQRLGAALCALAEWVAARGTAGWLRADETVDLPIAERLLEDLEGLRYRVA